MDADVLLFFDKQRAALPLPSLIQIAGRIMWCSLLRLKWTTNSCAGLRKQRRFLL